MGREDLETPSLDTSFKGIFWKEELRRGMTEDEGALEEIHLFICLFVIFYFRYAYIQNGMVWQEEKEKKG